MPVPPLGPLQRLGYQALRGVRNHLHVPLDPAGVTRQDLPSFLAKQTTANLLGLAPVQPGWGASILLPGASRVTSDRMLLMVSLDGPLLLCQIHHVRLLL